MYFHEQLAEHSAMWWFVRTHPLLFSKQMCFCCFFFFRISEYMDLTPGEVVGQTCYHFVYVEDLENLRQSHEDCE